MHGIALTAFGIAFWAFLAIATVAGIVSDYKRRRIELEPLRAAIERGAQLDPSVIRTLTARDSRDAPLDPVLLRIGGIITIASGAGLMLASWFIAQAMPVAFYPLLGVGLLAICVGLGILLAARALRRHQQQSTGDVGRGGQQA